MSNQPQVLLPAGWPRPKGYANGVTARGRMVFVAGMIGWGAHVLALLVLAQLLHAATFGAYHAASIAAVHRLFPGRLQATGQTLYSSLSYGLGGGAGLLIAGWSWERLGAAASFSLSAAFALAGAALVTWRVRV